MKDKDLLLGGPMKFIYPAIIHDDADGFWAEFPDLAYTSSTGSTLTELVTNAQEAMELYILGALEDGERLPTPTVDSQLTMYEYNLSYASTNRH